MGKRYILYLEPAQSNPLGGLVREFYEQSRITVGINEAQQYIPHCSITGFFEITSAPDTAHLLGMFCGAVEDSLRKLEVSVSVGGVGLSVHDVTGAHERIASAPSVRIELDTAGLRELAGTVKVAMTPLGVNIRPKPVDHISLAYITNYPLISVHGEVYQFASSIGCQRCQHCQNQQNRQNRQSGSSIGCQDCRNLQKGPSAECRNCQRTASTARQAHPNVPSTECQKAPAAEFDVQRYLAAAKDHFKDRLASCDDWNLSLYEEVHSYDMKIPHKFSLERRWSLSSCPRRSTYPDR